MSDLVFLLVSALPAAWLCAREIGRPDRRHLAGRIAASIAAMAALAALALEPALPRTVADARVVLATEGMSPARAREIADSLRARAVFVLGDSVSDIAELRRRHADITEVIVAGWGLSAEELARAGGLRISFVPAPLPDGIHSISWPSRVVLGEDVRIRGATDPAAWVHLRADGGAADSMQADTAGNFELRFTPRAAGLAAFELRSGSTSDTGAVDVRDRAPPAVLILERTPGFELAHLRRWLARRGGKVAARTTVSRGRTRAMALNGAPSPTRALDGELLREFDLVVMDDAAARALGPGELDALRQAVREEGLGIFIHGGARLAGLRGPLTEARPAARTIRVRRSGSEYLAPPVTAEAWSPVPGNAGAVVLEDNAGHAIAAWEASGAGRIGSSAVRNPSRWLLEGETAAYDRYWTALLASLERPKPAWRPPAALPAETDRPLSITWPGRLDTVVVTGGATADTLFPRPDPDSLVWSATWWPRSPGKFRVEGPGDTLRLRATTPGRWLAARAAERMRATRLHAGLHFRDEATADSRTMAPVPAWIFMLLFTGAAGLLWWERRRVAGAHAGVPAGGKEGRTGVG